MQEIKLTTENSDTVHVDSVYVSKGVYCKFNDDIYIVIKMRNTGKYKFIQSVNDDGISIEADTLFQLISDAGPKYHFFTIPDNRRIVTEKPLTVEPNSIIGIDYADGAKGAILYLGGKYHAMSFEKKIYRLNNHIASKEHIADLVNFLLTIGENRLFLFDAYDEKWAAWLTKK